MSSERDLSKEFDRLFCGMLLSGFGGLLAMLGFFMVALGCRGLAAESRRLARLQYLCLAFALLALFCGHSLEQPWFLWILPSVVGGVVIVWQLLGGVAEVAAAHDHHQLAASAQWRRRAYVVTLLASFLVAAHAKFHGNVPPGALLLAILPAGLVWLSVLHLLYLARWQFAVSVSTVGRGTSYT